MARGIDAIRAIALNKPIHLAPLMSPQWRRNAEVPLSAPGADQNGIVCRCKPSISSIIISARILFCRINPRAIAMERKHGQLNLYLSLLEENAISVVAIPEGNFPKAKTTAT